MNTHCFYAILLFMIITATVSCGSNNAESITTVDFEDAVDMQIDSITDHVDVIPLELKEPKIRN